MKTTRNLAVLILLLTPILFHPPGAFAAITAETVGKLQEDALAVSAVRDTRMQALVAEYKANDEREAPRAFKITMPRGMARRPMHIEMRRWGGKWLPGVSILPRYNKSRNLVDSSGCTIEGDSIKGLVEVTLISDGWVPKAGTTIRLKYDIDIAIQDGKIAGTYHAHENREMRNSVPENEAKWEATSKMEVRRGSIKDVLRLLPKATIHQYEHDGDLSGTVEPLEFKIVAPPKMAPELFHGLKPAGLYAAAVAVEEIADEAYRQIRATHYVRLTGAPYESALDMALDRPFFRRAYDEAKAGGQIADMQQRVARMRAVAESAESWKPGEKLCPLGELVTDDPRFRGYFCVGAFPAEEGKPNIVPAAKAAGAETWYFVHNWKVLGRYPEDRLRRLMLPMPELVPAAAAYRPGVKPYVPPPKRRHGRKPEPVKEVKPEDWRSEWKHLKNQPNPITDFGAALGGGKKVVAYAATTLLSESDQEVWAALLPDDFCQLWINDRIVWANHAQQKSASVFKLKLKKGLNHVLLRCDNDTHDWGAALKICTQGKPRTAAEVASAAKASVTPPLTTTGWFGPGHTGVYPDVTPVTAWDIKGGVNVLWRLPFDRKSIATPVIVGDKLFTLAEPHTLICVDKLRGRILWQRDSNILELIEDPGERKQALADWERDSKDSAMAAHSKETEQLRRALAEISVQLKADEDNEELQKRGAEIEAKMAAIRGKSSKLAHWFRKVGARNIDPTGHRGWFQSYVGYTAGTPVTDGKHIWVKHGTGVAACYDLEGNLKWIKRTHFRATASTTSFPSPMLVDGKVIIVGGGAREWQKKSKSKPLPTTVHGGQLGSWMIALDQETGDLVWDAGPIRNVKYGICNTPYPMKLSNGKEEMWVLVTSTGQLLRAEDGKQLLDHMGVRGCFHASPIFYGNNVLLSRGGHVDSLEIFMKDRDTVGARHLWTSGGGGNAGTVLYRGLVHCTSGGFDKGAAGALSYRIKDAATGRDVAFLNPCLYGGSGDPYVSAVAAGDHIFAFAGNACAVIEVGHNPRVIARMKNERMYAHPVFEKDRMYLRTYESLMCIGPKGAEGENFVKQMQAKTIMDMFPWKIRRTMTTEVACRTDIKIDAATPVEPIVTGAAPKKWIWAGPFPMREDVDPLKSIGGCAKALPIEGTVVELDGKKLTFQKVDPKSMDKQSLDINAMRDPGGSARFYYTILDNRIGRKALRIVIKGGSTEAWVGGKAVRGGDVVLVDGIGLLPVLIKVKFPPGLPPFRKRARVAFFVEEVNDPSIGFRKQVAFLKKNEDALRRVIEYAPGGVLATRAQYLLGFVEVAKPPK